VGTKHGTFARYIPLIGEPIGYGDKYINKVFKLTEHYRNIPNICGDYLVETRDKTQNNDVTFNGKDKNYVKVGLFLCSNHIPDKGYKKVYHEEYGFGEQHSNINEGVDNCHVTFSSINYDESGYNHTNIHRSKLIHVIKRIDHEI
jgi:hypothetical protein